jgi:hypothetical protein
MAAWLMGRITGVTGIRLQRTQAWYFCRFLNLWLGVQALLEPVSESGKRLHLEYGPTGLFPLSFSTPRSPSQGSRPWSCAPIVAARIWRSADPYRDDGHTVLAINVASSRPSVTRRGITENGGRDRERLREGVWPSSRIADQECHVAPAKLDPKFTMLNEPGKTPRAYKNVR